MAKRQLYLETIKKAKADSAIFYVRKDNVRKYYDLMNILFKKSLNQEPIDIFLLGEFLDLMRPEAEEITSDVLKEAGGAVIEYFKNSPDYYFKSEEDFQVSFETMVKQAIIVLALQTQNVNKVKKTKAIQELYWCMRSYVDSHRPRIKNNLTHYKLTVISTCIAHALGIQFKGELSDYELEGRQPTKEQLYRAGNLATKAARHRYVSKKKYH